MAVVACWAEAAMPLLLPLAHVVVAAGLRSWTEARPGGGSSPAPKISMAMCVQSCVGAMGLSLPAPRPALKQSVAVAAGIVWRGRSSMASPCSACPARGGRAPIQPRRSKLEPRTEAWQVISTLPALPMMSVPMGEGGLSTSSMRACRRVGRQMPLPEESTADAGVLASSDVAEATASRTGRPSIFGVDGRARGSPHTRGRGIRRGALEKTRRNRMLRRSSLNSHVNNTRDVVSVGSGAVRSAALRSSGFLPALAPVPTFHVTQLRAAPKIQSVIPIDRFISLARRVGSDRAATCQR